MLVNNKYLNNNQKIKKNEINIFIPMLFGFKNNKLTKTFYYENMYYKIFYLIFNHILLIEIFFKDKKIFYNFSKYFQTNLYIYLIKKKSIILNLFFHFFYVLFLTFENLEDIYSNRIFFKGYKHRLKYKTFFKRWVKPDYGIKFYFKQRINAISLYVLNFSIYKNFYFSKYNLFLIHTKLIYKLFYYFKMLQYKLQSFLILYKPLCKFEKKTRLIFAKTNCIIYKNLNNKLINFFALYKNSLKKNVLISSNLIFKSFFKNIFVSKKPKLSKKVKLKPIYNANKIKIIKKKTENKKNFYNLKNLKTLNNIVLAKDVFKIFFNLKFNVSYFNLFYNSILKLNWLKEKYLTNKIYYKKLFNDFLIQFFIKYSISTKLIRRYDIYWYDTPTNFYYIIEKFINDLKNIIEKFIINFFDLTSLIKKAQINFIEFVMEKMKFNLLLNTIIECEPVSLKNFYSIILKIFEKFLNTNFTSSQFHFDLDIDETKKKTYLFSQQYSAYDSFKTTKDLFYRLFRKIQYKIFIGICYNRKNKFIHNLLRNQFSEYLFSIDELPAVPYDDIVYEDLYGRCYPFEEYLESHFNKFFYNKKNNKKNLKSIKTSLLNLREFALERIKRKKKRFLLQALTKKLKKNSNKVKFNKLGNFKNLKLLFVKKKKYNNLIIQNFKKSLKNSDKKFLFFYNMLKNKIFLSRSHFFFKQKKKKLKNLKFNYYNLKKKKFILKLKKFKVQNKKVRIRKNKINKLKKKKLLKVKIKLFNLIQRRNEKKNRFVRLVDPYFNRNNKKYIKQQRRIQNRKMRKYKLYLERKRKRKKKYSKKKLKKSFKKYRQQQVKQAVQNYIKKYMKNYIKKYSNKYNKKDLRENFKKNLKKNLKKRIKKYKHKINKVQLQFKTRYIKRFKKRLKRKLKRRFKKKKLNKKKKRVKKKSKKKYKYRYKYKYIPIRVLRKRLKYLNLKQKKELYTFLKSTRKSVKNESLKKLIVKVKHQIMKKTPKVGIPKKFFTKKFFKIFTKLKFFKTKSNRRKFIYYIKFHNKIRFKFIRKTKRKTYIDNFFKRYKKFKLTFNRFNKNNKFNKNNNNKKSNKIKKSNKNKKTNKNKKIKKKKKIQNNFNNKKKKYKRKDNLKSKRIKNSNLTQKKLIVIKQNIKKDSLYISPFKLYTNNLQLLNKKINKLRKLKFLKKHKKLKKLNRQKILLNEISSNYFKNLYKFLKELKIKYLNIKNKIKLLEFNSNKFELVENNKLKQKLNDLKIIIQKKLKNYNKIISSFNVNFKFDNFFFKKKLKKKTSFLKKPFFKKTKFFKTKAFKLTKRSFSRKLINFYSKNKKNTFYGKKFKKFLKSAYFKKLINYSKHYNKFLQIQKRILYKKLTFRINYFLLKKGFYAFCKLSKRKKLKKRLKKKSLVQNKKKKNIKKRKIIKKKKNINKKQNINKKRKQLLIKYNKKLIKVDLRILKLIKQNLIINNLKVSLNNFSIIKNDNNIKLLKLYRIKSKINKLKNLKLNKLKLKLIKLKCLKLKKLNFIKETSYIKLIKKKILKLTLFFEKRKNEFLKLKNNNNYKLIKLNIVKLRQVKLKLNKLKLQLNKLYLNKLKVHQLILNKKKKKISSSRLKLKKQKVLQVTEKVLKRLYLAHKLADEKLLRDDLREMQRIKDLKKKEDESFFKIKLDKNATTFDSGLSFKERQRRHIYRVQKYYKDRQKRLELDRKQRKRLKIPRTKKHKFYFSQQQKYIYLTKKLKQYKLFSFKKYTYFFNILLKTRLKLFKNKKLKNNFNFLFLNKLKNSIKTILFKNKSSYYSMVKNSFDGMNFYNEYKLWYLHFRKLKKIPFNLIRLYSKFYFNKLLYNLKIKSNFYFYYYKYLQARTKVKYFNNKQSTKSFKKKRIKRLAQIMFYKLFKFHMKYFIASKNVIFSLMRNGSFYMYYKLYEVSRHKIRKNQIVSLFLTNLKKRRSFYVSKSTSYSNFFFIYWAKKYYGYNVYGNYKHSFDEFNILKYYFKFFKSKTFFFNYLINFIFSYIQKININIFNYVFILNQYKTKLIINSNQFFKYLILFHFKRDQYFEFFNLKEKENIIIPRYFSFFSLFFKELSIELTNWYSLVNNSSLNLYQSTFLFNLCFINNNTNAVYLHYKYKYLYYYRVYNFYIFYIFYYLYNHLFKVYKKLKLKEFKLSYDLIKYNEYNRYYLGLRTRMLILTIRNRYKRGFTVEKIFRNLKFFLRESMKKKELAGYYISIRGRYKRSSRSNKLILKKGVYSFNKIDLKIDSSYGTLNTKYGIAGIKVIFAFK